VRGVMDVWSGLGYAGTVGVAFGVGVLGPWGPWKVMAGGTGMAMGGKRPRARQCDVSRFP
jgi:hypothetical protein